MRFGVVGEPKLIDLFDDFLPGLFIAGWNLRAVSPGLHIVNYRYRKLSLWHVFRLSLSSNMIIGIFTDYRYGRLSLSEHVIIAIIVIENMKFYRIFDNIVR